MASIGFIGIMLAIGLVGLIVAFMSIKYMYNAYKDLYHTHPSRFVVKMIIGIIFALLSGFPLYIGMLGLIFFILWLIGVLSHANEIILLAFII